MGSVSEEDHTRTNRMGGMEILVPLMFAFIGAYVLYWVVRMGVRDGIADADERRNESGPESD
jgi:hypothetical protein